MQQSRCCYSAPIASSQAVGAARRHSPAWRGRLIPFGASCEEIRFDISQAAVLRHKRSGTPAYCNAPCSRHGPARSITEISDIAGTEPATCTDLGPRTYIGGCCGGQALKSKRTAVTMSLNILGCVLTRLRGGALVSSFELLCDRSRAGTPVDDQHKPRRISQRVVTLGLVAAITRLALTRGQRTIAAMRQ